MPSPVGDVETANNLKKYFSGYDTWQSFFSFVRCLACDLLYTQTYPDEVDLQELYSTVAHNEVGQDGPALDATHTWLAKQFVAEGLRHQVAGPEPLRLALTQGALPLHSSSR